MRVNWRYIQIFLLIVGIVFLYSFSGKRNTKRVVKNIHIEYLNGKDIFISKKTVNNLLIVHSEELQNKVKDSLDLKGLENSLNENPLIANAEVYQQINGDLGVIIKQREPIARVIGKESYYIDKEGVEMPLSKEFSARVPLVYGADKEDVPNIFPFLKKMQEDKFLKKYITGIMKNDDGDYITKLRKTDLTINFGDFSDLNRKIRNLKVFYQKAYKDEMIDDYTEINLKYSNQVVCTKKNKLL